MLKCPPSLCRSNGETSRAIFCVPRQSPPYCLDFVAHSAYEGSRSYAEHKSDYRETAAVSCGKTITEYARDPWYNCLRGSPAPRTDTWPAMGALPFH